MNTLKCKCGKTVNADTVDYVVFSGKDGVSHIRIRTVSFCSDCNERLVHRVQLVLGSDYDDECFVLRDVPYHRTDSECVDLCAKIDAGQLGEVGDDG